MLRLLKSLSVTLGRDFRNQLHTNFVRIEDYINSLTNKMDAHKTTDLNAHNSKQITDNKFGTVDRGLEVISTRYSNLVLSHGTNSLQEVKDARVDNMGFPHLTLFDRLLSDANRFELKKDEIMATVVDAKDQVLAQEFAFDLATQQWQYLTNLSPWNSLVIQHFYLDNKTNMIYATQTYEDGYKITKMKPSGQFVSQMFIDLGGHSTHNGYRWVGDKLWIYSYIIDPDGFNKVVRFSYKADVRVTYGDYDMEEVFTGHPELPWTTPVINNKEGLILYRIQYTAAEQAVKNAINYIEVRRLSDVDAGIDDVLYKFDLPISLTGGGDGTQTVQGIDFGEGELFLLSGDSTPDNPNFLTVFDLETGTQKYQKLADMGKAGDIYPGHFQAGSGVQLYYDEPSGKKALLVGVTVGALGYRSHEIHGVFMRDVYDRLTAQALPTSQSETGGRVKTFPLENLNRLADVIEPGEYHLRATDTKTITDFPLPTQLRSWDWFLHVGAPNQKGQVKQTLTRNTFTLDVMEFVRVVSVNKLDDVNSSTKWNHQNYASIGSSAEPVPNYITNMNQLGIVANKQWWISIERSKQLADHPKPGFETTVEIEAMTSKLYRQTVTRLTTVGTVQVYVAHFSAQTNARISPWTLINGTII